jgi:hypothetical protein
MQPGCAHVSLALRSALEFFLSARCLDDEGRLSPKERCDQFLVLSVPVVNVASVEVPIPHAGWKTDDVPGDVERAELGLTMRALRHRHFLLFNHQ